MTKKTVTELKRALRLYCRAVRKVAAANRGNWDAEARLMGALQNASDEVQEPLKASLIALNLAFAEHVGHIDRHLSQLRDKLTDATQILA